MECFDLYDVNRNKSGKVLERGNKVPEGYYRLVVHVCIFDSEGRMLIQKRLKEKKGWSGMWDITAGGSALAGDSSQQAASRELNMDVDIDTLKLQATEVEQVRWATEEEILEMMKEKEFVLYKSSFISLLFFLRNHNGAYMHKDPTR